MAKGIVYVMTCTQGLLKIGKCQVKEYENRMHILEENGYKNFNGLKREFAVEVEDYDRKEKLCHELFDKSQVKINGKGIEMFAIDNLPLVKELLLSFGGTQIYPSKEDTGKKVIEKPSKNSKMTFEMLEIPVGSTLTYISDSSIKCKTINNINMVSYQKKEYTLSGLVKHIRGGGTWQGGAFFSYEGKKLTDLRKEKGV